MSGDHKPPPVSVEDPPMFDATVFFEAIPRHRERARAQVPTIGQPTPRVQAYIDNGEWDGDVLVSIHFVLVSFVLVRLG